jgi:uncharacterized cupredoxin-like copper-binding protein
VTQRKGNVANDKMKQFALVLPVVDAKVDESQVDIVGEIEEFRAGETASGTFDLTAGNYILLCNIPAHFGQGMYLGFTVQ